MFDHILLNSAEAALGRVWPRLAAFGRAESFSSGLILSLPSHALRVVGRAWVAWLQMWACSAAESAGSVVRLYSSCPPACSYFKLLFSGSAVATGWAALLETIFSSLFSLLSSLFSLHSSLFILHSSLFSLLLYSPLLLLRLLRNFQCLLHGSALGCVADASGLGSSS